MFTSAHGVRGTFTLQDLAKIAPPMGDSQSKQQIGNLLNPPQELTHREATRQVKLWQVEETRMGTVRTTAAVPNTRRVSGTSRRIERLNRGRTRSAQCWSSHRTAPDNNFDKKKTARTSSTCCHVSGRKKPQASALSLTVTCRGSSRL
jgi:hypothetical protein